MKNLDMEILKISENIMNILQKRGHKVATAESCTGGSLAFSITALSGASNIFDCGVISYSNEIKHKILGVNQNDLNTYGAVSEIVVSQMCQGALKLSNSKYAMATSGVAGPNGGSKQKPVGCVYICVASQEKEQINRFDFKGDRNEIQKQSVLAALNMLFSLIND